MSNIKIISISEAARQANISRAALRKHIKIGRIKSINGQVELNSFNQWLKTKQPSEKQEIILPTDKTVAVFGSISDAELHKTSYEAKLKELDYDLKSEQVVLIEDVVSAIGAQFSSIRTRLLAMPAETAPQLFNCKTVAEVQGKLHRLIVRLLEDLSVDVQWQEKLSAREKEISSSLDEGTKT